MKKSRSTLDKTYKNRLEILLFLRTSGPKSFSELNEKFNQYKAGCIYPYLKFLLVSGNIVKEKRDFDRRITFKFIKL